LKKVRFHDEELHNLYASPNVTMVIKSRSMRWAGHVAHMGEINDYDVLVGKPERKGPLGRPRSRWEGNIRMDPREIVLEDVDLIHLAQDRGQWLFF
jgi:hypothetical protein